MLGLMEFHNSLKYLFFQRNAVREMPFSNFQNKQLFMDLDFSYSLLQQNQLEPNMDDLFENLNKQLKQFNIEFQGIC